MVKVDYEETVPYLYINRVETSYGGLGGTNIKISMQTPGTLWESNIDYLVENGPVVIISFECYQQLSKDSEELERLKRILNG